MTLPHQTRNAMSSQSRLKSLSIDVFNSCLGPFWNAVFWAQFGLSFCSFFKPDVLESFRVKIFEIQVNSSFWPLFYRLVLMIVEETRIRWKNKRNVQISSLHSFWACSVEKLCLWNLFVRFLSSNKKTHCCQYRAQISICFVTWNSVYSKPPAAKNDIMNLWFWVTFKSGSSSSKLIKRWQCNKSTTSLTHIRDYWKRLMSFSAFFLFKEWRKLSHLVQRMSKGEQCDRHQTIKYIYHRRWRWNGKRLDSMTVM